MCVAREPVGKKDLSAAFECQYISQKSALPDFVNGGCNVDCVWAYIHGLSSCGMQFSCRVISHNDIYSSQMTLLKPLDWPGVPGVPTWRFATSSPSAPVRGSRWTMATLDEA